MLNSKEYLGMADINDEDNYVDLCLKLGNSDITDIATHGLDVRVFSTRKCNYIVPPKGDCLSQFHPGKCGDVSMRPQSICVQERDMNITLFFLLERVKTRNFDENRVVGNSKLEKWHLVKNHDCFIFCWYINEK